MNQPAKTDPARNWYLFIIFGIISGCFALANCALDDQCLAAVLYNIDLNIGVIP